MTFEVSELDTKINDIIGPKYKAPHDRTLRQQIMFDEKRLGLEHIDLDSLDDDELNMHIGYLAHCGRNEVK